jgi:hypothetical protein
VPGVELDPDRVRADLVDQLDRVAERVHDRPVLDPLPLEGLEREPQVQARGFGADLAEALDDGRTVARAGQADDAGRVEGGEAVERAEDRGDPLARVVRARQERQRVDRGDRRDGGRRPEAARLEALERVGRELQLPDADAVDPGLGIRGEVLGEARAEGADLRDREPGDADGSDPTPPFDI